MSIIHIIYPAPPPDAYHLLRYLFCITESYSQYSSARLLIQKLFAHHCAMKIHSLFFGNELNAHNLDRASLCRFPVPIIHCKNKQVLFLLVFVKRDIGIFMGFFGY